ncbi:hypothetical protein BDB00DRAFT_551060 [Zychaea mexicana]|uniref:uncharacterized protein n=1 Tax=Zychaea mexicana TaxID=64656 RepID=UPI0022FEAD1F|nr:uncharacterized protein BDB00DRAFT_551060 [Zychaea mexicana]KAI9490480.1 hypothetical protein BDB00DRAFT_551060 [Zychaea mexicana]
MCIQTHPKHKQMCICRYIPLLLLPLFSGTTYTHTHALSTLLQPPSESRTTKFLWVILPFFIVTILLYRRTESASTSCSQLLFFGLLVLVLLLLLLLLLRIIWSMRVCACCLFLPSQSEVHAYGPTCVQTKWVHDTTGVKKGHNADE